METNERFITAPLLCKEENVLTVEPVGTEEQSTSSSSNTDDFIPKKVRQIFDSKGPQDFFRVYFINAKEEIMATGQWFFEGRHKDYEDRVTLEADGPCNGAIVLFQGRTKKYEVKGYEANKGTRARIACKGAYIP